MKDLNKKYLLIFIICIIGIISVTILSVSMGTKTISKEVVYDAIFKFDESNVDHIIIRNNRLPRAIAVLVVILSCSWFNYARYNKKLFSFSISYGSK